MKVWVGVLVFVLGVGAGFAGTRFIPTSVSMYLPVAFQPHHQVVKGSVVRKHQENERLLLTVSTPQGALLATFTQQVSEIDLLVEERDEVTLGLAQYAPFIHDPVIKGVMKPDQFGSQQSAGPTPEQKSQEPLESTSQSDSNPLSSEHDVVDPQT